MEATGKIFKNLLEYMRAFMKGKKLGLSHPVLREENGKIFLSFFVTTPDFQTKQTPRPEYYILSDISSGKLNFAYQCTKRDFCNEPYDRKYSTLLPSAVSREMIDQLYSLLDRARQSIIETNDPAHYRPLTDKYMARLKDIVPTEMAVFYDALYRLPDIPAKEEMPFASVNEPADMMQKTEEIKKETPPVPPVPPVSPVTTAEPEPPAAPAEKKAYTVKDVSWKPEINLTTLHEDDFRILEKVADAIKFLPCDTEGQIRYAYPLFCFEKDRMTDDDIWKELEKRTERGLFENTMGHFRLKPKKSIYNKCPNAKESCMFRYCPYIAAAYIKYLKETDPGELVREREEFRLRSAARAARQEEGSAPVQAEAAKAPEVQPKAQNITVTQNSPVTQNAPVAHDTQVAQEVRRAQEVKEPTKAPVAESPSKQAASENAGLIAELLKYTEKNGYAHRCLANPNIINFYGNVSTYYDDPDKEPAVMVLKKFMQAKGYKDFVTCRDTDKFEISPFVAYYIYVTGKRTDLSVLRHFVGSSSVVLVGRKAVIDEYMKDPVIGNIYRRCSLRGSQRDYGYIYDKMLSMLPDGLKQTASSDTKQAFISWIQNKSMPDTDTGTAEFLAWQCMMENRLIFVPRKEGDKNAKN